METTMTAAEYKLRTAKSYKLLLMVAIISMIMMFAGLTSAFVVSKSRADWLKDFQIPQAFYLSTVVIICCSISFHFAKTAIKKGNAKLTTSLLFVTLLLGAIFVALQFRGFGEIVSSGYYFTGAQSSITTTFLYIVTLVHLLHLAGGIVALLVIIFKHLKGKYNASETLGIELGAMYWHFLDLLWIYLFLFLFFFQ
jgi:cytochrome c oxidase subunit 3